MIKIIMEGIDIIQMQTEEGIIMINNIIEGIRIKNMIKTEIIRIKMIREWIVGILSIIVRLVINRSKIKRLKEREIKEFSQKKRN